MGFYGHELINEMRESLGMMTVHLCVWFVDQGLPVGRRQVGEPTIYRRRTPADSELDPHSTIADQFDLLRVVDNDAYPAFFNFRGCTYKLTIEKVRK